MSSRHPMLWSSLLALLGCSAESPPEGNAGAAGTASAGSAGISGSAGAGGATGGQAGSSTAGSGGSVSGAGGSLVGGAGNGGASGLAGTMSGGAAGASGTGAAGVGGIAGGGEGGASGSSGSVAIAGATAGGAAGSAGAAGAAGTVMDPGVEGDGDFTISAPFTAAPETRARDGVPKGTVHETTLSSTASAIYPLDVASDRTFERALRVYVPNGYVEGTPVPFMLVQDGSSYAGRIVTVLDNLIADGRLPAMVAIFVNPGPGDGPGSQRGLEYDTVSETYVNFIETEILPKVQADYAVELTDDPEGRASFGCSSGGAAAFTMGWFRPDLYRRILTYSGTFTNQAPSDEYPHGAWEYHENLIPESEPKPLRVFLEVGSEDNGASSPASGFRNWVLANQGMAAALAAKAYHYRFIYAEGGRHCDTNAIAETLPDAMLWLWRGYPI
jgi:enterochelin esterase family protein